MMTFEMVCNAEPPTTQAMPLEKRRMLHFRQTHQVCGRTSFLRPRPPAWRLPT